MESLPVVPLFYCKRIQKAVENAMKTIKILIHSMALLYIKAISSENLIAADTTSYSGVESDIRLMTLEGMITEA